MSEQHAGALVTVVIPYFQRAPGLLSDAIRSIGDQILQADVRIHIIVVDDGSPHPASSEALPALPSFIRLKILLQDNRGVAAARNAGLDAASPGTDFVAFLDSDDVWEPTHLSSALSALNPRAPLYFDDTQMDEEKSAFDYSPLLSVVKTNIGPAKIVTISQKEILEALIETCAFHTSQVVYDFSIFKSLRFDEDQKYSGEDHLFFLRIIFEADSVVFSTGINGRRGSGVSLFRETLNWASPNILSRLADEVAVRSKIAGLPLTPALAAVNSAALQRTERCYVFLAIHRSKLLNFKGLTHSFLKICRIDHKFLGRAPVFLLQLPRAREDLLKGLA